MQLLSKGSANGALLPYIKVGAVLPRKGIAHIYRSIWCVCWTGCLL